MLIQSVEVDYGPDGIRAKSVCPGWTRTETADMEMSEFGFELGVSREDASELVSAFVPSRRPRLLVRGRSPHRLVAVGSGVVHQRRHDPRRRGPCSC